MTPDKIQIIRTGESITINVYVDSDEPSAILMFDGDCDIEFRDRREKSDDTVVPLKARNDRPAFPNNAFGDLMRGLSGPPRPNGGDAA